MYPQLATLLGILTVGLLSPGPDFFLIVKNSMSGSRARAFGTAWGIAGGLTVQVLALMLGLAMAPSIVLRIIQMAGAVFLAWVGLRAVLARGGTEGEAEPGQECGAAEIMSRKGPRKKRNQGQAATGFMEGFLCNVTNVKVFVFFVSLFSQFIRPDSDLGWKVLMPMVVVVHGVLMWCLITWALLFPPVARLLAKTQRWLPRAFGFVLIAFALFVVWESLRGGR